MQWGCKSRQWSLTGGEYRGVKVKYDAWCGQYSGLKDDRLFCFVYHMIVMTGGIIMQPQQVLSKAASINYVVIFFFFFF